MQKLQHFKLDLKLREAFFEPLAHLGVNAFLNKQSQPKRYSQYSKDSQTIPPSQKIHKLLLAFCNVRGCWISFENPNFNLTVQFPTLG